MLLLKVILEFALKITSFLSKHITSTKSHEPTIGKDIFHFHHTSHLKLQPIF